MVVVFPVRSCLTISLFCRCVPILGCLPPWHFCCCIKLVTFPLGFSNSLYPSSFPYLASTSILWISSIYPVRERKPVLFLLIHFENQLHVLRLLAGCEYMYKFKYIEGRVGDMQLREGSCQGPPRISLIGSITYNTLCAFSVLPFWWVARLPS